MCTETKTEPACRVLFTQVLDGCHESFEELFDEPLKNPPYWWNGVSSRLSGWAKERAKLFQPFPAILEFSDKFCTRMCQLLFESFMTEAVQCICGAHLLSQQTVSPSKFIPICVTETTVF